MLGLGGGGGGGGGTGGATIAPTELPSKKKRNNSNMTFIITVALQLPKLELVVNAAKDDQHKILDIYIYIYTYVLLNQAMGAVKLCMKGSANSSMNA